MKKQYIYSALILTAVLTAGCAKEIENTPDDRDSSAIELSSVSTDPMTKAVITGTSFTTDEAAAGIGLFLLDGEGNAYGSNEPNVKYTFSSDKWTATSPLRVGNTEGTLVGYYPYSSTVTDITAIPVASSINGTDYLYGSISEINSAKAKTESLTLSHALARLRITFKRDASFVGDGILSSLTIEGNGIAASGTLDATTGIISATKAAFTVSELNDTITTTGITEDCLMVPAATSDNPQAIMLKFTVDGKEYKVDLTEGLAVKLQSGIQTDITLTVKNTSVTVNDSSINPWGDGGSQTVTVGGDYTVTVAYSSDSGIKDDVWIKNVEVVNNSVVVTAQSITGQRLKCTMPDGEFCTSQSKTENLVYTFSISDITSDKTATIGYAKAVSIFTSVYPNNSGVVRIVGELYEGETVKIVPEAAYSYGISSWKDQDDNLLSDGYDYTVRLSKDMQITACFEENLVLGGVFTVASDDKGNVKKVRFTRGNLYYDGSIKIEQLQYDFNSASYTSSTAHVSHFMWCMTLYESIEQQYVETGTSGSDTFFTNQRNFTVFGFSKGKCLALSKDEWSHLLTGRAASTVNGISNARYFKGCIQKEDGKSMNGMFIFPDEFTWPSSVKPQPTGINEASAGYTSTYTYNDFKRLQDAGIVFLPAAGHRYGGDGNPTIDDAGGSGFYWSASSNSDYYAYVLGFSSGSVLPDFGDARDRARAVRLVMGSEVKPDPPVAVLEISTAAEWNEFATAYNEGSVQDCSISIIGDLDFTDSDVVTIASYESEKKFSGTIYGNNHVVKNLHSSKSLIGSIGADGVVQDLIIDETCTYTVIYGPDDPNNGCFGPFASSLEGKLVNCENKASITLDKYNAIENDADIFIGGLIGCINGGIADGCFNYGTIIFNETYTSTHNAHAGGIVGYVSSAAGTVTDCTNVGELINHTCWAGQVHMGGIVGYSVATVTNCTNVADLSTDIENRPDDCEHISMAGIVGYQVGGTITYCTNSGNILSKSKVEHQYIGGICGIVGGTVTNKGNTSSGNIHSTSTVRNPIIGGLYGRVDEDNTFEFSGRPFTGKIHLDNFQSGDNTFVYVGGLIGICRDGAKLIGIGATPVAGPDSVVIGNTANKSWRLSVGGIVGAIGETWTALKDTLNLGDGGEPYVETYQKVTEGATAKISNFRNVGTVVQLGGGGIKPGSRIGSFGGIIGGMLCGGTIENCVNDGAVIYLEANSNSNSSGYPVHVGGIVGRADGSTSVIKGCSSSGEICNRLYNNNNFDIRGHRGSSTVGGIAGSFGYKPLSTATLTIEDCHSTGVMYAYRGPAGGIIGYANHTTVKNSSFKENTIKRGGPVGGIIGAAENCAAEGCTVKVSELKGVSGGTTSGDCGGIIGDARGCSVDGCRFFGTVTGDKLIGGIFGRNDANCTIGTKVMCTYGGKVGDADIDDMFYIMYYAGASDLIDVDITTHIGYWNGTL